MYISEFLLPFLTFSEFWIMYFEQLDDSKALETYYSCKKSFDCVMLTPKIL